jgi:hypothetical protein
MSEMEGDPNSLANIQAAPAQTETGNEDQELDFSDQELSDVQGGGWLNLFQPPPPGA